MDTNINNLNLEQEVIAFDPDAKEDNNFAPVPDGTYQITVSLGKFGIKKGATQQGKPKVSAHLSGVISAPGTEWDNRYVNGTIDTNSFKNEKGQVLPSLVHKFLIASGRSASSVSALTQAELADALESTLQSNPQVRARTRWGSSVQNSEGGTPAYLRVKGMKNYPQDHDGNYIPEYTFTLANGDKVTKEAYPEFADFKPVSTATAA